MCPDDLCSPSSATCQCPSVLIHATCQCPSVPHISAYQCTSMPHSAHLSCLSVPPNSASQCRLSVPYECCLSVLISDACQCPSV
ncbi:unnamed protein product, partial [Staurois parvus]